MGKGRRIKSVKDMEKAWIDYKDYCDNKSVLVHEFSHKLADFVSKELKKPITYTIKGFALSLGMTEQNFYATYRHDPKFERAIDRMKDDCEIDAREKFELGVLNPRLSGLWMSKYGYSVNKQNLEE